MTFDEKLTKIYISLGHSMPICKGEAIEGCSKCYSRRESYNNFASVIKALIKEEVIGKPREHKAWCEVNYEQKEDEEAECDCDAQGYNARGAEQLKKL